VPGPLAGIVVVELAGMGPGPHACMLLADLGAVVVRVTRPDEQTVYGARPHHTGRSRERQVHLDLKSDEGRRAALDLIEHADVLVEGFRPGATERMGLGPEECLRLNPGLVYARLTGWGQSGPLAQRAGHDINYLSLTGMLHAMGPTSQPTPPLNLVADFGGGSMFAVMGILASLIERRRTGAGRVIDAAMVDGVSALSQAVWEMRANGDWSDEREQNVLDGGAPYYRTYACSDGSFIAVGCLEEPFYREFVAGLGLDLETLPDRGDKSMWPKLRGIFEARIGERGRAHWERVFADTDACVTPVLTMPEVAENPHIAARGSVRTIDGELQAAPAPRFE
jgi:alpha-methylacyl-CoA racemase